MPGKLHAKLPYRFVKVPESVAKAHPPKPIPGVSVAAAVPYYIASNFFSQRLMCLDGDTNTPGNGTKVQLWRCNNTSQQLWYFIPLGNHNFLIQNAYHGRLLDAHKPCLLQNGCRVQLWDWVSGNVNQVWYNWVDEFGAGRLQNAATSNMQLDANRNYGVDVDGTPVQLWQYIRGQSNQQWAILSL